jgi:hypothetical protein
MNSANPYESLDPENWQEMRSLAPVGIPPRGMRCKPS